MRKSLFLALCLLAATASGQADSAGGGKLQITVIPLPIKDITPPEADEILALVSKQLRENFRAQVISGRTVGRSVWGELDDQAARQAGELDRLVDQAFKAYRTLELDKADRFLSQAERALQFAGAELASIEPARKFYFTRGLVNLGLGKKEQAGQDFQAAAALDLKFQPPPNKFSPGIRQAYQAARDSLLAAGAYRLSVLSRPEGARVTVDGVPRGVAPLEVELYPGPHFVRLELEDHARWTVNIPPAVRPKELKARLVRRWMDQPPRDLLEKALAATELAEEELAVLRLLSGLFRSDALLLVGLSRQERNVLLGVRLFTARPESVGKARLFNLGADPARYESKLRGVISTLEALAKMAPPPPASIAAAPPAGGPFALPSEQPPDQTPRPEPPPGEGQPAKGGSWYTSWWFWTAVGVAVAGAAAGTAIWLTRPADSWTLVVRTP
jgi:tetratricopeptide (TPR) repeat protein